MANRLTPAREQLERLEDGLDRLLTFTNGDVSPSVFESTCNQLERLERLCTKEDLATTAQPPQVILPPKPNRDTVSNYMRVEQRLASLASTDRANALAILRLRGY